MKFRNLLVTFATFTLLVCTAVPSTVFAADQTMEQTTEASTEFSYMKQNTPTYTISIPSTLSLADEGSPLTITASDISYLGDKRISVTIAGTDYYRNQLVLTGKTSKPSYSSVLRYQLIAPDGTVIETTGKDTATGTELASFTEAGSVTYTAKPVSQGAGINLEPGIPYKGTMTFGISLVE